MKRDNVAIGLGIVIVAMAVCTQDVQAQRAAELSAKALFYDAAGKLTSVPSDQKKPEPVPAAGTQVASGAPDATKKIPAGSQAVRPLALRATVLLVTDGGGTREIKPSHKFKSSDRIKVAFTASRTGYFYLATIGSSGRVQLLSPRANEPAILEPGYRYVFPASPTAYFRFDGNVGREELWAILSDDPLSAIDMGGGLVAEVPASASPGQTNLAMANKGVLVADVASELGRKDLLFEEDSNALYVSTKPAAYMQASTAKPTVIVKLTLSHD